MNIIMFDCKDTTNYKIDNMNMKKPLWRASKSMDPKPPHSPALSEACYYEKASLLCHSRQPRMSFLAEVCAIGNALHSTKSIYARRFIPPFPRKTRSNRAKH